MKPTFWPGDAVFGTGVPPFWCEPPPCGCAYGDMALPLTSGYFHAFALAL
jgi:hypothetical protein